MSEHEVVRAAATGTWPQMVVLAAVAAGIALAVVIGRWLQGTRDLKLDAAPFYGRFEPRITWGIALAAGVAVLVAWRAPDAASRFSWASLLGVAFVLSVVWGLALALTDGTDGITRGLTSRNDYLVLLERVEGPGEFIRTFLDRIENYTVHVRGHPPGLIPVLWWLDRAGLGGMTTTAAVVLAAGASAVPAALIATKAVAGEDLARRAAPFLVLTPAFVWIVTSADALFLGVGAWGVTLVVVATSIPGMRSDVLAAAGGAILGAGLFLSYGLLALAAVPLAVIVSRRCWRVLTVSALGGAIALTFPLVLFGFWWLDGLAATRAEYFKGVGAVRPFVYFAFANLVVFAVVCGPAPVAALARLRDHRLWLLVGGALVAVFLADLSGLSKGEVERIWLPFWPWVAVAAAGLSSARRHWWMGAQAATAIGIETLVFTHW